MTISQVIRVNLEPRGTRRARGKAVGPEAALTVATIDLTPQEAEGYYYGYANRCLWPSLHYRLDLAQCNEEHNETYFNVSARFADAIMPLVEPDDLAAALDASPAARAAWDGFPPSARKQMLWSVVSASRPATRAARITKVVAEAELGRRSAG